jgi:hypothetical protein
MYEGQAIKIGYKYIVGNAKEIKLWEEIWFARLTYYQILECLFCVEPIADLWDGFQLRCEFRRIL